MQSPELPVAIIAVVGSRVAAARARALQAGLLKMGHASGVPTRWSRCVCAASCCPSCRPTRQRRDPAVLLRVLDARGRGAARRNRRPAPRRHRARRRRSRRTGRGNRGWTQSAAIMNPTRRSATSWRPRPAAMRMPASRVSRKRPPVCTETRSRSDSMRARTRRARASS